MGPDRTLDSTFGGRGLNIEPCDYAIQSRNSACIKVFRDYRMNILKQMLATVLSGVLIVIGGCAATAAPEAQATADLAKPISAFDPNASWAKLQ
jgi:hypothetical protein